MRAVWVATAALMVGGCQSLPTWRPATAPGVTALSLPRIPRDAARFEIDSVNDSTATFRVREATWVRPGLQSYVVDPAQRDALVARMVVVSRSGESATALVTGQVTSVKADHFLLVVRPVSPWWKSARFWSGAAAGAAATMIGLALF